MNVLITSKTSHRMNPGKVAKAMAVAMKATRILIAGIVLFVSVYLRTC